MANYLILICEWCDASLRVRRGDLPETCAICRLRGNWRVALPNELTKADRRLLKGLRITADPLNAFLCVSFLLLFVSACAHHTTSAPAKPVQIWILPSEANENAPFCVESKGTTPELPSDEALGPACVTVRDIRRWVRGQRYAP